MRNCKQCSKIVDHKDKRQKFCDRKCYKIWFKGNNHHQYKTGTSKGSIFTCLFCDKTQERRRNHQKYCTSSCQLYYEYKTGKRCPIATTRKAILAMSKTKVSKPQLELFEVIKKIFPHAQLNHPYNVLTKDAQVRFIDIYIPGYKIAFEYDEPYWHNLDNRDEIRDKELKDRRVTVIHYWGYIPTETEVREHLEQIGFQPVVVYYGR